MANAEIIDIDKKKFDLFQEVFSDDYIKIALVIKEKKMKTGMNHEDLMAKKLEKLSQGLNVTSKGIGNESKFGLGKSKGVAKPAAGVRNSTTISE